MPQELNKYEYAYRGKNNGLIWRTIEAKEETEAIKLIRERHKEYTNNSFFPYAGPLLIDNGSK